MSTPAPAAPVDRTLRVLLVDDQAIVAESVRRMLADDPTIEFHYCQDPTKAIATANDVKPTVILQDLVMPDIDGLMLVKFFRANAATKETPMIVLSSKEEPVVKAKAFSLGANDYIVKLPDKLELMARVKYHSGAYLNLLERNEAYKKLAASQEELAREVAQAARYVQSLLPPPLTGDVTVTSKFVPSTQLGGDMFGYHWLDSDHLAIYLLDVSGHGVGSSLLAVTAASVLSARSLPDTDFRDPAQVGTRLNDTFQMERQDGKYFTVFYGVFQKSTRKLRYCNAAHPAALLFSGGGVKELGSDNPVIGMLPPGMPFDAAETDVPPDARLLIFSDGVFEIERADETYWPFSEFVQFATAAASSGSLVDALYTEAKKLGRSEVLADDFSVLHAQL